MLFKYLKSISPFIFIICITILYSCTGVTNEKNGIQIITSLFPQYDAARHIAGDFADVTLILPPGSESHLYDPSVADIRKINDADLFIYTGDEMEPWAGKIKTAASHVTVLNLSDKIRLIDGGEHSEPHEHDEHNEHDEHDETRHSYDPHIWLSPENFNVIVDEITEALIDLMPENKEPFRRNAIDYKDKLNAVYNGYAEAIETAELDTVVFGGRFAFGYFFDYYPLNYVTALDSCSADAEPSIADVMRVTDYVNANNIPVIFHEELADPKIARSISESTGAELLLFSTGHNITKEEYDSDITFIDILKNNLENLKIALKCR